MNRIVETKYGRLQGVPSAIQKFTLFKGVPYARPPIGDLRWRAPEECEKWDGVRLCDKFAPAAMQPRHPKGSFYEVEFYQGGMEVSEDCLYLNVWADLEKQNQPVMLWIHGGAYRHGFSHEMEFDGDAIAKRGVILVTINYRVNVFGFMAHPELTARDGHSGNYGLMDQIFALKWVRENIAAFGGDPENITIFGQSAGGGSVQALMASPLTAGMFRRSIIQSAGSPLNTLGGGYTQSAAEETGIEIGRAAQCDLAGLYKLEARALMEMSLNQGGDLRLRPCVDNYVLTADPGAAFARGDAIDESFMLGCVTGDAALFDGASEDQDQRALAAVASLAKARVRQGKRGCYVYHFCPEIPGDDHPGAFHSSELWYIFGTLMRSNRPFTGADYELSQKMTDWWTNFARTGDPGNGWTAYTAENPAINEITSAPGMVNIADRPLADSLSGEILENTYGKI
jgi:para-nitrobenzyl esterase